MYHGDVLPRTISQRALTEKFDFSAGVIGNLAELGKERVRFTMFFASLMDAHPVALAALVSAARVGERAGIDTAVRDINVAIRAVTPAMTDQSPVFKVYIINHNQLLIAREDEINRVPRSISGIPRR